MAVETLFDERVAAHYEAWYESAEGWRADALEKATLCQLLEGFSGARGQNAPLSILEVGSGTGHFTRWFAQQGLAAVGLDSSAAMLAQAQALDGVSLVQGDACTLAFGDGTFDLVALVTTLEFLEHPKAALAEALRISRQGLLLGVLNRHSLLGLQRRLAGFVRPSIYNAAHLYRVGELKRLLQSVADERANIVWHTTLFPRVWPWSRSNLPWGGFIGMALHVPPKERSSLA